MPRTCAVCDAPSHNKCARCKQAYYCSRDHQREHWFERGHREACVPFAQQQQQRQQEQRREDQQRWATLPSHVSTDKHSGQEQQGEQEVTLITTPSTTNAGGEPATLLRPRMSAAYYDAAEQALQRVETFDFTDQEVPNARHPNARQAVHDFIRVRRDVLQFSRMTAAIRASEGTLSTGEMLRNGTTAANSLLSGRARHEAVPRDSQMTPIFERMEAAVPENRPLSFYCGFADATMEAQMLLRDLSEERQHQDPMLVAATATCSAMYIVLQDRIRARLDAHARGAAANPEVVRQLEQMHAMRTAASSE